LISHSVKIQILLDNSDDDYNNIDLNNLNVLQAYNIITQKKRFKIELNIYPACLEIILD